MAATDPVAVAFHYLKPTPADRRALEGYALRMRRANLPFAITYELLADALDRRRRPYEEHRAQQLDDTYEDGNRRYCLAAEPPDTPEDADPDDILDVFSSRIPLLDISALRRYVRESQRRLSAYPEPQFVLRLQDVEEAVRTHIPCPKLYIHPGGIFSYSRGQGDFPAPLQHALEAYLNAGAGTTEVRRLTSINEKKIVDTRSRLGISSFPWVDRYCFSGFAERRLRQAADLDLPADTAAAYAGVTVASTFLFWDAIGHPLLSEDELADLFAAAAQGTPLSRLSGSFGLPLASVKKLLHAGRV